MFTYDTLMAFISTCPERHLNLVGLLEDIRMLANSKRYRIDIGHWVESRWYIELVDLTMYTKAEDADGQIAARRLVFSFDVAEDRILWNHEGGNCMVRGKRCAMWMRGKFNDQAHDNEQIDMPGKRTRIRKHYHMYGNCK